jgi:hypothetical protein
MKVVHTHQDAAAQWLASFCRERQNSTVEWAFPAFFGGKFLLANVRRDVSHLRDDSPPHRTACQCRPLLDGQRRIGPAAGGSQLRELSRGAAGDAADEFCRSRTATAGRAA